MPIPTLYCFDASVSFRAVMIHTLISLSFLFLDLFLVSSLHFSFHLGSSSFSSSHNPKSRVVCRRSFTPNQCQKLSRTQSKYSLSALVSSRRNPRYANQSYPNYRPKINLHAIQTRPLPHYLFQALDTRLKPIQAST